MQLADKIAIVTGGASGIGRGVVERFVEAGAFVGAFDIDAAALRSVADALGERVLPFAGDVAAEEDARGAVEAVAMHWGGVDVLVNNAGVEVHGTVEELAVADWDRQLAVNLRGAFLFSRFAIPHMRRRGGGAIVNVSSVHAQVSWPGVPAYDTSKSGLIGLTRAMALDHGRDGIRVNAVCPGYINTAMTERWLATVPDREAALARVTQLHAVGRIGQPRDVAEACLFLASEAASFITGTWLVVDGGMTAAGH